MNLAAINAFLNERRIGMLSLAVANLEAGIEAGEVQNVRFNDAKDTINRAVDEAVNVFDKASGDRWGESYGSILSNAHGIPAAIKDATKRKNAKRADFLKVLLPLNELLAAAKPLIVKRGDKPKTVSPKEAAKLARSMTCQCCARKIFAETGRIAHHGYERPGGGYQTASCYGARELPFEVSRDTLGGMIAMLRDKRGRCLEILSQVKREKIAIGVEVTDRSAPADRFGNCPTKLIQVTRATFDKVRAENESHFRSRGLYDFDRILKGDIARREREIEQLTADINGQQARFDGWKQTHEWDGAAKKWQAVKP